MRLLIPILKLLRASGTHLLTSEEQIRTDLRVFVAPPPSGTEISEALNHAEQSGYAISTRGTLDQVMRWRITDLGRSALSEAGQ